MKARLPLLAFVAFLLLASSVIAQPGGGRRGGKGRDFGGGGQDFQGGPGGFQSPQDAFQGGRGGRGGRGGFGGGPQDGSQGGPRGGGPGRDPSQFIESMLARFDTNGDGTITPDEVAKLDDRARSRYEGMVRQAGRDPSQAIKVSDLRDAMVQNMGQRGGPPGGAPPGMAAGGGKPGQTPVQSAVPGFGVEAKPVSVAGFSPAAPGGAPPGVPSGPSSPPGSGPGGKSGSSPPSPAANAEMEARLRAEAERQFRQFDKNGDGVIDKNEMANMPGGLRRADRNGDGKITREEFTAQMMEFAQRRGGGGPGPSGPPGSSGTGSSPSSTLSSRKSYKFSTAEERLPKNGLPPWFPEKDARHNGQITMAEYGAGEVWSDELAVRFAKYDLNNDGIITADEAVKVFKAEVPNSPVPNRK